MKKIFGVSFVLASFVSFASAYLGGDLGYNLGNGMERLIYLIESLFGPFFAVLLGGTGEFLFERILFLFIVLSIVYVIISRIDVFKNVVPYTNTFVSSIIKNIKNANIPKITYKALLYISTLPSFVLPATNLVHSSS